MLVLLICSVSTFLPSDQSEQHMCNTHSSSTISHRLSATPVYPGDELVRQVFRSLKQWMLRAAERRALRELSQSGHLLNDIGLSREQALREASKPFWRP
jgi:uncharacterized protein YjiS (DUF1127 family)